MDDRSSSTANETPYSSTRNTSAQSSGDSSSVTMAAPSGEYLIEGSPADVKLEVRGPDFIITLPDGSEQTLLMAGMVTASGQPLEIKFANGEVITGDQFIAQANYQESAEVEHLMPDKDRAITMDSESQEQSTYRSQSSEQQPENPDENAKQNAQEKAESAPAQSESEQNTEGEPTFSDEFSEAMAELKEEMDSQKQSKVSSKLKKELEEASEKVQKEADDKENDNLEGNVTADPQSTEKPTVQPPEDPFEGLPEESEGIELTGFEVGILNLGAPLPVNGVYIGGGGNEDSTTFGSDYSTESLFDLEEFDNITGSIQGDDSNYFSEQTIARKIVLDSGNADLGTPTVDSTEVYGLPDGWEIIGTNVRPKDATDTVPAHVIVEGQDFIIRYPTDSDADPFTFAMAFAVKFIQLDPDNPRDPLVYQAPAYAAPLDSYSTDLENEVNGKKPLIFNLQHTGDFIAPGGNSNDNIDAGVGNDIVNAGAGNDTLKGGIGDDELNGGTGTDTVDYSDSNNDVVTRGVVVNLQNGTATDGHGNTDSLSGIENVDGTRFGDTITGDGQNNILQGKDGDDTLNGGAGNDTLYGGDGNDQLNGGAGDDTFFGGEGADELNGGAGSDTVDYSANSSAINTNSLEDNLTSIENIIGTAYGDTITGGADNNRLQGNGGNDTLNGGSGIDTLEGGAGNDTLISNQDGDTLDGGTGVDDIADFSAASSISVDLTNTDTTVGSDTIRNIENIIGTSGDDTFSGNSQNNHFDGGTGGNDTVHFNRTEITSGVTANLSDNVASYTFDGDATTDTFENIDNLTGSIYQDTLTGDGSSNTLTGNAGNDTLNGEAGDDTLNGDAGDDSLYGGAGVDTLNGGADNDVLYGEDDNDILNGDAGNDTLYGGEGDDTLTGGEGDDTFYGGNGTNTLNGGDGDDTADYSDRSSALNIDMAVNSNAGGDVLNSIENITATNFNDDITGDALNNNINGGDGNDTIDGNTGNDILRGEIGDDIIEGGAGDDEIYGGEGNDTLTAGAGTDELYGDAGNDTLITGSNDDYLDGGSGIDTADYSGQPDSNAITVQFYTGTDPDITAELSISSTAGDTDLLNNVENITGSQGDDTFRVTGVNNSLDGQAGVDTVIFDNDNISSAGVTASLETGEARYTYGASTEVTDTLDNIENVTGSELGDELTGDSGTNVLNGGDGNDQLLGSGGSDTLIGGSGTDTADYSALDDSVTATLAGDSDGSASFGSNTDTLQDIENLTGSRVDDNLTGDQYNNTLEGQAGIDTLTGMLGSDTLRGGTGDDILYGGNSTDDLAGDARDELYGDAGDDELYGGLGDDRLEGGDDDDFLRGGAGADTIDGGDGNDTADYSTASAAVTVLLNDGDASVNDNGSTDTLTNIENITGSSSNDSFGGDASNNRIDGGGGIDTILFNRTENTSGATVELADGTDEGTAIYEFDSTEAEDTLISIENITGSSFADTFTGNSDTNLLSGKAGADTLNGGGGNDTLSGGDDNDTLNGDAGIDTLNGDAGDDTLNGGEGTDTLNGGADNDILNGDSGNDILNGGTGSDTLNGGNGDDDLFGNEGDDTFLVSTGDDEYYGGDGNDDHIDYSGYGYAIEANLNLTSASVTSDHDNDDVIDKTDDLESIENLTATEFDDTITGNNADNHLRGQGGNDGLYGGSGIDNLEGGAGNDTLQGEIGADTLNGGAGMDVADYSYLDNGYTFKMDSTSSITITDHNNSDAAIATGDTWISIEGVIGTTGDDILIGGAFNNILDGGADDSEDGGDGDTVDFSQMTSVPDGVEVRLSDETDSSSELIATYTIGSDQYTDTLRNIENLTGTDGDDTLTGNSSANILYGGVGNDTFSGQGGSDEINGWTGLDTVTFEWFTPGSGSEGVTVTRPGISWNVAHGSDNSTLTSIETIHGSNYNDTMTGDDSNGNTFYGLDGHDTLTGGDGHDRLYGGDGNDTLYGGYNSSNTPASYDTQDGYDRLEGGAGDDIFYGGTGVDTFVGGSETERYAVINEGGFDTVNYSDLQTTSGIEVNWTYTGANKIRNNGQDTSESMYSVEQVIGSNNDDVFTTSNVNTNYTQGDGTAVTINVLGDLLTEYNAGRASGHINGGAGDDTVNIDTSGSFNFDGVGDLDGFANLIDNIETLDFRNNGNTSDDITISTANKEAMTDDSNDLTINLDSTDTITIDGTMYNLSTVTTLNNDTDTGNDVDLTNVDGSGIGIYFV
ncbi:beta strand repeat-containing protein [Endozoicomonas ascidiicola]|uniref:beta strand repeat-containing protein n=1 Tax=Endozoicomonas ascidiicola TaxID=1698521 RepID=UPI00082CF8A7|nr:calcium-binding protein [Endozoicomonas ascidiicola]